MQTHEQAGNIHCPRCGAALPRPTVACARRSCRPAALRPIRLQPVDTDPKMNVVLPSSLSQADSDQQLADPVTPLSVVTLQVCFLQDSSPPKAVRSPE